MVDIHFTVFNLLYRDPVLRRLLINYADRVEHSKVSGQEPAATSCFLTLKWAPCRTLPLEDGSEILTVRVHIPDYCWNEHLYLDSVLGRVQAAFSTCARSESIRATLLRTSCTATRIGGKTIFKASSLVITPTVSMSRAHPDGQGGSRAHAR
jgi:hypothetical protein